MLVSCRKFYHSNNFTVHNVDVCTIWILQRQIIKIQIIESIRNVVDNVYNCPYGCNINYCSSGRR